MTWFLNLSTCLSVPFFPFPSPTEARTGVSMLPSVPRAEAVFENSVMHGCTSAPVRICLRLLVWTKGPQNKPAGWQGSFSPGTCLPDTLSPEGRLTWGQSHQPTLMLDSISHSSEQPCPLENQGPAFRLGNPGSERPCHFSGKRSWNSFCPRASAQMGQLPHGPGVWSVQWGSCTLDTI